MRGSSNSRREQRDQGHQVDSSVREHRRAAGLTQDALARQCGISRQALIAIEAGRAAPSVVIALRLAAALERRVEELFRPGSSDGAVDAELATSVATSDACTRADEPPLRVALAQVEGRWIAHPLWRNDPVALSRAADGLLRPPARPGSNKGRTQNKQPRVRVEPLQPLAQLGHNLFVVGCDPALGLLADRISGREFRATWLHAPSQTALDMLARGHTHVAGAHLFDESSGEFNLPFVQRAFAAGRMLLVTLASWELGLVVRPGHKPRVRGIADVLRPGVRFIQREPGAGARVLVERLLRRAGAPADALARVPVAHGHLAVAQAVAMGGADTGVATHAAALAHGLAFVPLAEERFDLVLPREHESDPRIVRLVETLQEQRFRRELASLGGYETRRSGQCIPA